MASEQMESVAPKWQLGQHVGKGADIFAEPPQIQHPKTQAAIRWNCSFGVKKWMIVRLCLVGQELVGRGG